MEAPETNPVPRNRACYNGRFYHIILSLSKTNHVPSIRCVLFNYVEEWWTVAYVGGDVVRLSGGSVVLQRVSNHPPIEYLSLKDINLSVYAEDLSTSESNIITMSKVTNISVTWETHSRLSLIGIKGESFNHIVERLLDAHEVSK